MNQRILILGGGFGGLYTLINLGRRLKSEPDWEITLVNREPHFLFTPLIHEVATGGLVPGDVVYNLRSMFNYPRTKLLVAEVQMIELDNKVVKTSAGDLPYDTLVYALGADTNMFGLSESARQNVFTLKNLADAKRIKNQLLKMFETGQPIKLAIVGGGPTGVEIAGELTDYLLTLTKGFPPPSHGQDATVWLIQATDRLLNTFDPKLAERARELLTKRGVTILLNTAVKEVNLTSVTLTDGRVLPATMTIWVPGVRANIAKFEPPLEVDKQNRLIVTTALNLAKYPEVFVVGDAASGRQSMSAQAAVAMAKLTASNILAGADKKPLADFCYRPPGQLFSLGQWRAGAELYGWRFFGRLTWWLWRTIYLTKIVGWRNKIKVATDWTFNLFLPRDLNKL